MNLFEPTHLILVIGVIVLLFGGKKIPELMRGVGQGVGELQKGLQEGRKSFTDRMEEPVPSEVETPVISKT